MREPGGPGHDDGMDMTAPAKPGPEQTAPSSDSSTVPGLRVADRCDRCPAQAYVITVHGGLQLLWCGHHFQQNAEALDGLVVIDTRESLTAAHS